MTRRRFFYAGTIATACLVCSLGLSWVNIDLGTHTLPVPGLQLAPFAGLTVILGITCGISLALLRRGSKRWPAALLILASIAGVAASLIGMLAIHLVAKLAGRVGHQHIVSVSRGIGLYFSLFAEAALGVVGLAFAATRLGATPGGLSQGSSEESDSAPADGFAPSRPRY